MSDYQVDSEETKYGIRGIIEVEHFLDDSPRDWDNIGFFVTTNNRYFSLQEGDYSLEDCENVLKFRAGEYEFNYNPDTYPEEQEMYEVELEEIQALSEALPVILPIYMYVHGGVTIRTGSFDCPWDSGQVGFYYTTADVVKKEGTDLETIERCMEGEIKTMDQYLTGDVYCILVEDADGEMIESCCGFYGLDHAREELKSMLEFAVQHYEEDMENEAAEHAAYQWMMTDYKI